MNARHHALVQRLAVWRRRDDVRHHENRELADAKRHREVTRAQPRSPIEPLR